MRRGSSTSARFHPRFRGTQSGPRPFTRARRSPTPPEPSLRLCRHRKPLLLFDRVEWSHCPELLPTVRLTVRNGKLGFGSTAITPSNGHRRRRTRCPPWVKSGGLTLCQSLLVAPDQRTSSDQHERFVSCHKLTLGTSPGSILTVNLRR